MKFCSFLMNMNFQNVNTPETIGRTRKAFLKKNALLLLCGYVLFLSGCAGNQQFGHPSLEPAPANVQTRRATRFDPYPDPNLGPEIHGVTALFHQPKPRKIQSNQTDLLTTTQNNI